MITPVVLPWPLHSSLEAATRALFDPGDRSSIDFSRPAGSYLMNACATPISSTTPTCRVSFR